jgi:hypothetical protein
VTRAGGFRQNKRMWSKRGRKMANICWFNTAYMDKMHSQGKIISLFFLTINTRWIRAYVHVVNVLIAFRLLRSKRIQQKWLPPRKCLILPKYVIYTYGNFLWETVWWLDKEYSTHQIVYTQTCGLHASNAGPLHPLLVINPMYFYPISWLAANKETR